GVKRAVDELGRSPIGIDDVALLRDRDHGRRQGKEEAAACKTRPVINQDDLAAVLAAPQAPDQPAVGVGHINDVITAGAAEHGVDFAAAPLDARAGVPTTQSFALVVPHEHAVAVAHDEAVAGLYDHAQAALAALFAQVPKLFDVDIAWPGRRSLPDNG